MRIDVLAKKGSVAVLMLLLVACGGGGSSDPGTGTGTVAVRLSGIIADGYLRGAKACLDLNHNKKCDAGEPTGTSGAGGVYEIEATQARHDTYPVVVEVPATAIDEDTSSAVGKQYVMSAPAGKRFVSPITTMVQTKIDANPALSTADAEGLVKSSLGFSSESTVSLFENYVAAKADTSNPNDENYQKIHNIARVTASVIADNYDLVTTSSAATNIDFNILVQVIVQAVIAELETITTSVESATTDANGFVDVGTVSGTVSTVDTTTLDETIAQQELEASGTVVTTLLDAFKSGLTWFWAEFPDSDYGTITSDANGLLNETMFIFNGTSFVASTPTVDDEYVELTTTGWQPENDTLVSAQATEANGKLDVVDSNGNPRFSISSITVADLSGKNMRQFLGLVKSLDPEESWSPKNVSAASVFSTGAQSNKLLFQDPEYYGIGYWNDGICTPFTLGTGTNCNVEYDEFGAALTVLTDVIGTTSGLGPDLNYTLNGTSTDTTGTVTFARISGTGTALPASSWSLVTINTEQLVVIDIPPAVRPLTWDVDPPKAFLTKYDGYVRLGWYEAASAGEIFLVNNIARDDMVADFRIDDPLPGIWRPASADVNGAYNLLAVFDDANFLYVERGPNPQPEDGVEIGTYTRDAFNGTFASNLTYDDNTGAQGVSGIGSLGQNVAFPGGLQVINQGNTLEVGPLGFIDRVNTGQGGVGGAWFTENASTGFYAYMILMPDNNTFVFMQFDPANTADENGVDVGTYTYANGNLNFTGTWDDSPNAGMGDLGITNSAPVTLATDANGNETLTLDPANQNITFNRLL